MDFTRLGSAAGTEVWVQVSGGVSLILALLIVFVLVALLSSLHWRHESHSRSVSLHGLYCRDFVRGVETTTNFHLLIRVFIISFVSFVSLV